MLQSIRLPSSIVWLPLRIQILEDIRIVIICGPVCDVMNFEINLGFLKSFLHVTKNSGQKCNFLYVTKNSGQKCKYTKNRKSF